ncbi:TBC1 domain family member 22B isoform X2 [Macrotis lagotis]|uniref:TBC1 domain family member 22B isoform X2 n=1 Tax=Macrotis lagotis TaxID=92651 RepID=UPI003D69B8C0
MAGDNSKQFWKRSAKLPGSIQPVYGAQHPPLDPRLTKNFIKERSKVNAVPLKNKKASSFHEFARNTSDAWDIGDDEDEDFSTSSFQTLNSKVALATAAQVLENHSKLRVKPERSQSTATEITANFKVIKSSSDAQLSRNSGDTCLRNPLHKQQSLPLRPIIPLVARISDQNASGAPPMTVREKTRLEKFRQLLSSHNTDLDELRKCSWPGVPREVRPVTWRLLSIHIDIPRTNPLIPLFQQPLVQEIFERILFIWAIRHPASGYVQGINDLVTPFFVVFLSEYVEEDVENFDVTNLSQDMLRSIEADSFWCMSKLLDGIQDNYTFAQPGIQKKVQALEELVSRIDEQVHNHFRRYEVEYLQFAFRWMNNLLMRELPLRCTIRLWDTYQSEPEGFSHFHLYVCAAFLIKWRKEILDEEDFQGLLMLLQNLPTIHWGNEEIGLLLAEAYRLKYIFADAPNHYRR